jgi:acyl-CoA hydrolase
MAFMAGYALAAAIEAGRLRYLPVRLGSVPTLVADLRPDIAVVTGIRRGSDLAFAATVGPGPAMTLAASRVVVEVASAGGPGDGDIPDLGAPLIPGDIVATIERPAIGLDPPTTRPPDPIDLAIGRNVAAALPDRPTLQFGPGGIAEAILACLDRPVSIWSGLVTESVADLAERGILEGDVTAAYAWPAASGPSGLAALARQGRLDLQPIDVTHDISRIAAIDRFVGCNTALQVGLDGSVNVERAGRRLIAGIGGHADFCAGAARSRGGLSLIALRSTTPRGASTIVAQVQTVSTPRCDVQMVVTEHGVADLRGVDDAERARLLAGIAAPEHRAELLEMAP